MLREKGVSPVFLLAPCLALGAAAGVYLRRRASDDELVSAAAQGISRNLLWT